MENWPIRPGSSRTFSADWWISVDIRITTVWRSSTVWHGAFKSEYITLFPSGRRVFDSWVTFIEMNEWGDASSVGLAPFVLCCFQGTHQDPMNGSYSIVTSTTVLSLESKWPWNMELSHLLSLPVFVVLTFFGRAMYFVFFPVVWVPWTAFIP